MLGQNKELSKFGQWAYRVGLTQGDIRRMTGLSHVTVSSLFNQSTYKGTALTRRTVIACLENDYNVKESDFW